MEKPQRLTRREEISFAVATFSNSQRSVESVNPNENETEMSFFSLLEKLSTHKDSTVHTA